MKWPMYPLKRIAEVAGGSTPKRNRSEYWGGNIPWVTPTDLPMPGSGIAEVYDTVDRITERGLRSCAAKLLPVGTVLYSSRATIGKIGIARVPLATNQGFVNFTPKPGIESKYLAYALLYFTPQIASLAGSTTFKEVRRGALKKYKIRLPPPSEQRRIVEILDQADALRKKRAEADAKAARILPALFYKMFGDPATNPRGWEQKPFDLVFEDRTARSPKLQKNDYQPIGRFPVVDQGKEFIAGYCDEESLVTHPEYPVIMFGDHTRVVKYVDFPFVAGADGSRIFAARDGFVPAFLAMQLQLHRIPNLGYSRHMRVVRRLHFLAPPTSLQEAYEKQALRVRPLLNAQLSRRSCLESIWHSLLHLAFTGHLTAQWRKAHMKELLEEMEQQAQALEASAAEESIPRTKSKRHAGRRVRKAKEKRL